MKYRKDGTEQIQIGGRKPPYTLYVRATNTSTKSLRAEIEEHQAIARRHMSLAFAAWKHADELEQEMDAVIAAADLTNDEMHGVVVQQSSDWIGVLRRFVWREPNGQKESRALSGQAPSAA